VPPGREADFVHALRANLLLPADAALWAPIVFGSLPCAEGAIAEQLIAAGAAFFEAALAEVGEAATVDYRSLVSGLKARTGTSGAKLFKPLRAALTHRLDGPELAPLLSLLSADEVRARFEAAKALGV
jgi:glutamyl-tRNA synthetase